MSLRPIIGPATTGPSRQPMKHVNSETVIQTLNMPQVATADATGAATFQWSMVPSGQVWQAILNCPTAPDTAVFSATAGADSLGSFRGANVWGPVQLNMGFTLQVTAAGLIPGTQYVFNMLGTGFTSGVPADVYPTAYADSVTTSTEQIFLAGPLTVAPGGNQEVTLSSLWRSVWVVTDSAGAPTVVGDQSGLSYVPFTPPYVASPGAFYRFPLISGIDTSVTITWKNTGKVWYGADLASIDTVSYSSSGGP